MDTKRVNVRVRPRLGWAQRLGVLLHRSCGGCVHGGTGYTFDSNLCVTSYAGIRRPHHCRRVLWRETVLVGLAADKRFSSTWTANTSSNRAGPYQLSVSGVHPQCDGKECGDSRCGTSCGECAEGSVCEGRALRRAPTEYRGSGNHRWSRASCHSERGYRTLNDYGYAAGGAGNLRSRKCFQRLGLQLTPHRVCLQSRWMRV